MILVSAIINGPNLSEVNSDLIKGKGDEAVR